MSLAQQFKVKREAVSPRSETLAEYSSSIFWGGTVFLAELSKQVSAGADWQFLVVILMEIFHWMSTASFLSIQCFLANGFLWRVTPLKLAQDHISSRPINKSIRPASAHCRSPESHLWILMVELQWKTFGLVYRFSVLCKVSQLQLNLTVFPIHYYGVFLQYPTCSTCSDLLCSGIRFIKSWLLNPFLKIALTLLPWKGLCAQGRWHVPHWSHPWRRPNRYQQLTKKNHHSASQQPPRPTIHWPSMNIFGMNSNMAPINTPLSYYPLHALF